MKKTAIYSINAVIIVSVRRMSAFQYYILSFNIQRKNFIWLCLGDSATLLSFSGRKNLILFTCETKIDGIVNNKVHNCH